MAYMNGVLAHPIDIDDTQIIVGPAQANALAAAMAVLPASWAYADIYTALTSETVLITAINTGTNTLTVQRGVRGSSAMPWAAGSCICDSELVPANSVPDDGGEPCPDPLAGLSVCPALTYDDNTNTLCLAPTGVVPGDYGGAVVNQYGQFVSIPLGWPASSLPVFDPCCPPVPPAGPITAAEVSYAPPPGSVCALGGNVQIALEQLDGCINALAATVVGGFGVASVTQGAGISVTGTLTNPIVGLAPSGVAAGIYGAFTIDQYGRITSAAVTGAVFPAAVPLRAEIAFLYSAAPGPYGSYTLDIPNASTATFGLTKYANPADFLAGTVPPADLGLGVSADGLLNALTGPYGQVRAARGVRINPLDAREVELYYPNLPIIAPPLDPVNDLMAYYDISTLTHRVVTIADLLAAGTGVAANGQHASAKFDGTGAVTYNAFNCTIANAGAGIVEVTMGTPTTSGSYTVYVSFYLGSADYYVTQISPTVFRITWVTSGLGAPVPDISFVAFAV